MREQQNSGNTNFLADLAAIEFECSIAAAELNKQVHSIIEYEASRSYNRPKAVHVANESYEASIGAYHIGTAYAYNYHGESLPLVLLQEVTRQPDVPVAVRRKWLSKKVVEIDSASVVDQGPVPVLAVCFDDVALPIASFAHQSDSEYCSYVQLGSEINGGAIFGTKADEQTGRNDTVESLRKMVAGRGYGDGDNSPPAEVTRLASEELNRNSEMLRHRLTEQLGRAVSQRLGDGSLSIAGSYIELIKGEGEVVNLQLQPIGPKFAEGDHGVESFPAIYKHEFGLISIGMVHRSKVVVPLMSFMADGSYVYHQEASPSVVAIRQLTRILTGRTIDSSKMPEQPIPTTDNHMGQYRDTSLYAQTLGIVKNTTKGRGGDWDSPMSLGDSSFKGLTCRAFVEYLSGYSVLEKNPVKRHLQAASPRYKQLMRQFGADKSLEALSSASGDSETLMSIIGLLSISQAGMLEGDLRDLHIGKTKGDLTFRADISQQDSLVRLRLGSRPSSMPQERFKQLFDHTFDMLGTTDLPTDRVKDLMEVLRTLREKR